MTGSTEVPPTAPCKVTVLPIPVTETLASAAIVSVPIVGVNDNPVTNTSGFA